MESLVHYQALLIRRHCAALGGEECERLRANSLELLQRLEVLDPLRKQRYQDLGESGAHHEFYHRLCGETHVACLFLVAQHGPFHQINDVDCYSARLHTRMVITRVLDESRRGCLTLALAWLALAAD